MFILYTLDQVVFDLAANNRIKAAIGYTAEDLNQLLQDGHWDSTVGDLVIPGIAYTTKKNILIFNTNPNMGNSPISVVLANEFGGEADTEVRHQLFPYFICFCMYLQVPLLLWYTGSHYEGLVPGTEEDVLRCMELMQEYRGGTYSVTVSDIDVLKEQQGNRKLLDKKCRGCGVVMERLLAHLKSKKGQKCMQKYSNEEFDNHKSETAKKARENYKKTHKEQIKQGNKEWYEEKTTAFSLDNRSILEVN